MWQKWVSELSLVFFRLFQSIVFDQDKSQDAFSLTQKNTFDRIADFFNPPWFRDRLKREIVGA